MPDRPPATTRTTGPHRQPAEDPTRVQADAARPAPQQPRSAASDAPDPAVIAAAAAGDPEAWQTLAECYTPRLFALAKSRLKDPNTAEEIVQSVFVTLAEKLPQGSYTERGRFEPWLFRIAMNRIRDEARRRKRQHPSTNPATLDDTVPGHEAAPTQLDHRGTADDEHAALREAIAALEPNDREIIELRHIAQMSFKQIAAALNCPVGTALARHHRALKKLRTHLTAQPETQT